MGNFNLKNDQFKKNENSEAYFLKIVIGYDTNTCHYISQLPGIPKRMLEKTFSNRRNVLLYVLSGLC